MSASRTSEEPEWQVILVEENQTALSRVALTQISPFVLPSQPHALDVLYIVEPRDLWESMPEYDVCHGKYITLAGILYISNAVQ